MPNIFPRFVPQRGKIIGVVGNKAEKHKWIEIRSLSRICAYNAENGFVGNNDDVFLCYSQQCRKMFGFVGNNAE
jgi:hypothetical protein